MKNTTISDTYMTPKRSQRFEKNIADQNLQGLPFRHSQQLDKIRYRKDWVASLVWLRVPLLLLGVIGALGLLAHYNFWFAKASRLIHWPDRWISMVFLSIAGCVFFLLLIEWIYVKATKCIWAIQRRKSSDCISWRSK